MIRGLIAASLPALEEGRVRVLALLGGEQTMNGMSALPKDTYQIDAGGKFPYIVANPMSSMWAGANEAPKDTPYNAMFTRIEVECRSLCSSASPSTGKRTYRPRATRGRTDKSKADQIPFIIMALVQTGPLGPEGEIYVDYGDIYGHDDMRDYTYSPDKRGKPHVDEGDLVDLANQYATSVATLAVAHGWPDTQDQEAEHLQLDSYHPPLSLPMEGVMASSLHREGEVLFIEELFLTGTSRKKGKGPLLIDYTWERMQGVTEIHLVAKRGRKKDSPESIYRKLGFTPTQDSKDRVFDDTIASKKVYMSVSREEFLRKREAYRNRSSNPDLNLSRRPLFDRFDLRDFEPGRESHATSESKGLNLILHELHKYHRMRTRINMNPPNLVPTIIGLATHLSVIFSQPNLSSNPPPSPPPSPPQDTTIPPPPSPHPHPGHPPLTSPHPPVTYPAPPLSYIPEQVRRHAEVPALGPQPSRPSASGSSPSMGVTFNQPPLVVVTETAHMRVPLPESME